MVGWGALGVALDTWGAPARMPVLSHPLALQQPSFLGRAIPSGAEHQPGEKLSLALRSPSFTLPRGSKALLRSQQHRLGPRSLGELRGCQ